MLGKAVKMLLLGWVCGLCAPALANTTANAAAATDVAAGSAVAGKTRIALLLPSLSETFGAAAQAVRAGFMAAHEREPDGVEVTLVESADGAQNALTAYDAAQTHNDIVVGPLARADVATVARDGKVHKPTLALTQPESPADGNVMLPPRMLTIGFSIEDEARQLAAWAGTGRKQGKAFVIASGGAWQRRAARAFAAQWQEQGLEAQPLEIATSGRYLSAAGLGQLKKRLQDEKPALMFIGLDAFQAQQMLLALGQGQPAYGTSQLNPWSVTDWRNAEKRPEMNGVRLVDIPWLLQPDHPAAMTYPRQVTPADRRANPDYERLYALGIDAYRIAREIAAQRSDFELDGVTGRLTISAGAGNYRFRRIVQPAAYQDGVVAPLQHNP